MIRSWSTLDVEERELSRTVGAFLQRRLAEQDTIEWALKLTLRQPIERQAIEDLLTTTAARNLAEPWSTAWRLIEESWSTSRPDRYDGTEIYDIKQRLRAGDRSGSIVASIVGLVAPRLKVSSLSDWRWVNVKRVSRPRTFDQILSARLTSGELLRLSELGLQDIDDASFLQSLADSLDSSINHGLDIARRLGWDGHGRLWQLGDLHRAYYVRRAEIVHGSGDPDAHHRGIAPSVKLLHAVVQRLSELSHDTARRFAQRWRLNGSLVHVRMWAALSRDAQVASSDEVSTFFIDVDKDRFWDTRLFPEIAELRAVRFRDMSPEAQRIVVRTLRKGPPRSRWRKHADAAQVLYGQQLMSARELRRIEVGGGALPDQAKAYLESLLDGIPELRRMTIDEGFPEGVTVSHHIPRPDDQFETVSGVERLKALESALKTERRGWDDDPAERANDWLNTGRNADKLLADFEVTTNGGDDFPTVWGRFGWGHRLRQEDGEAHPDEELEQTAQRALRQIEKLSDNTLKQAIDGISAWLDTWEKHAAKSPLLLSIWLRVWPFAVDATNERPDQTDAEELPVLGDASNDDNDSLESDTLNSPAGKLIGVFLAVCPPLRDGMQAFSSGSMERRMRDLAISTSGRSQFIVRSRLIEALPYFLRVDRTWAEEHLLSPLLDNHGNSLALWRAVPRRVPSEEVLQAIGAAMAERATDRRLGRATRRQLVFYLVVECLRASKEDREPAVRKQRISQMLRTLDDEVRASAAEAIQQFVQQLSVRRPTTHSGDGNQEDPELAASLFRASAAPFLSEIWPQERLLATPGVSNALADLPAASGNAFAEAVDAIARFLVPFECWSLYDYGLYDEADEASKFKLIRNSTDAAALLRLLDLTIGTNEGSLFPRDLTDALEHIDRLDHSLSSTPVFRRLSALARR